MIRFLSFFFFFSFLRVVLEIFCLSQLPRPQISRCNQYFLCVSLESDVYTHTTYRPAVLTHTHRSTFNHKVQVSASRTAIGAVLSMGFILLSLCLSMSTFSIYIPRCRHLLSMQNVAGTVLFFHPPPYARMAVILTLSSYRF